MESRESLSSQVSAQVNDLINFQAGDKAFAQKIDQLVVNLLQVVLRASTQLSDISDPTSGVRELSALVRVILASKESATEAWLRAAGVDEILEVIHDQKIGSFREKS